MGILKSASLVSCLEECKELSNWIPMHVEVLHTPQLRSLPLPNLPPSRFLQLLVGLLASWF